MIMISIIVPTFNRDSFLKNISIPSVLEQKEVDWELIVVDDGSTDDTKKIVDYFLKQDSRIKYFYKANGGQGSARNLGLRNSRGSFIVFLDSDDALLPSALKILKTKQEEVNSDIVYARRWIFSQENRSIIGVEGPSPSSTIYKASLFYDLGFFDESPSLIGLEDIDLALSWEYQMKNKGTIINEVEIQEPVTVYNNHPEQITKRKISSITDGLGMIIKKYIHLQPQERPRSFFIKNKQFARLLLINNNIKRSRLIIKDLLLENFSIEMLVTYIFTYIFFSFYTHVYFVMRSIAKFFYRRSLYIYTRLRFRSIYNELCYFLSVHK